MEAKDKTGNPFSSKFLDSKDKIPTSISVTLQVVVISYTIHGHTVHRHIHKTKNIITITICFLKIL